jgi:hypothetical protein
MKASVKQSVFHRSSKDVNHNSLVNAGSAQIDPFQHPRVSQRFQTQPAYSGATVEREVFGVELSVHPCEEGSEGSVRECRTVGKVDVDP